MRIFVKDGNMSKYRPKYHFTPKYGWMNDPNGLIYFGGKYHMFFQHNPNGLVWNQMHWGHAVSSDLVHWEELPIALFPDEEGDIFSGSCIYDKENVSGLGTAEDPPLLAFYTSHRMKDGREMQCVASSTDGVTFAKYTGNPIIPALPFPARDPFVFRNPVTGTFSLCLTTEKAVWFYSSENLLTWEKTGEFTLPAYAFQGMIECPCIFFADVMGEKKAVLMVSMDVPAEEYTKFPADALPHSRLMQYFAGSFDGLKFVPDSSQSKPLLVDEGRDFYAGNLFADTDFPILIAWLGNSKESMEIPTEEEGFRGIMSYPRKLEPVKIAEGYRLRQSFYPAFVVGKQSEADKQRENAELHEDGESIRDGCVYEHISKDGLHAETYMK